MSLRDAIVCAAIFAALVCPQSLRAGDISVADYRARLESILVELDHGHLEEAQSRAVNLRHAHVSDGNQIFAADESILRPITKAKELSDAQAVSPRIKTLLAALGKTDPAAAAIARTDPNLVDRIRKDETIDLPPKDGEIDDGGIGSSGILDSIANAIGRCVEWVFKRIADFFNWLGGLFPESSSGVGAGIGTIVYYIVVAAAALVAALTVRMVLRNRRFRPVGVNAAPISAAAAAKDADPLSRDASQWEAYAAQLIASGRHREAVRAWYHAILVVLFRSGVLNYRKGRTNWEYYFSLPPEDWLRENFQELTGAFETEWYGRASSAPEDARAYGEAAQRFLSKTRAGGKA